MGWLNSIFRRRSPMTADEWRSSRRGYRAPEDEDGKRYWEAAETHRLNQAHWQHAQDQSINAELSQRLATLRARCTYEANNNGLVQGVIDTHETDLIGPTGPELQVLSDDEKYNEELEDLWTEWFARPDLNGELSGVEFLQQWVWLLWTAGSYLDQIVTDPDARGPVKSRLLAVHPRRLETPIDKLSSDDVVMGIRLDANGKPLDYYISKPDRFGAYELLGRPEEVPAKDILHGFRRREPDQVTGYPWLASSLEPVADLRDYDAEVLDAARAAATSGVCLYTEHPEAGYIAVNESETLERRTVSTMPPGWKPLQIQAQQPSSRYVDYREERQREIGRPVSMPLLIVRQDAGRHNYSSARFDAKGYERALAKLQHWLVTGKAGLNRLIDLVAREATLARQLRPRPKKVLYQHTFPKLPAIDPDKEAKGERVLLKNLTLPWSYAVANHGFNRDKVLFQLKRDIKDLEEAGLPFVSLLRDWEDDDDDDREPAQPEGPAASSGSNGNGRFSPEPLEAR